MSLLSNPFAVSTSRTRSLAVAALIGTTMLVGPFIAARAESMIGAPFLLAQAASPTASPAAAEMKAETIEQRITSLHTALEITPAEESNWTNVAQSMRDNAAAMQKLSADKTAQSTQGVSAVDDLKTYEKFAQAHVAGLKGLIASFETLYNGMPDSQKKTADGVFQSFNREAAPAHS
jgi:hypothetical protein